VRHVPERSHAVESQTHRGTLRVGKNRDAHQAKIRGRLASSCLLFSFASASFLCTFSTQRAREQESEKATEVTILDV